MAWDLSAHVKDQEGLFASLDDMKRMQGTTNTYTSLAAILDHQIQQKDSGRRRNIPLVVILLTDGRAKVGFEDVFEYLNSEGL